MAANSDAIETSSPRDTPSFAGQVTAEVDRITEPGWNSLLDEFDDASIYQTWAYGAVSWGENHLSHLVLRRGGVPVALAQVRIVRVPILGTGIAYIRWGPICTRKGSLFDLTIWRAAMEALAEEYVRRRGLALRVLPFVFEQDDGGPRLSASWNQLGALQNPRMKPYQTILVDLAPSLDEIRRALAKKWRNQLNAAERNGLEITEGTHSSLYAEFAGIYREMIDRKRFESTVNIDAFRRIHDRLPAAQKMLIVIARRDGRPVAGLVASIIGATGIYLLGATGDDGANAKGSYLLQWRLLQRLKELGCKWYDLGGINAAANPGVYHFKTGLGGRELFQIGAYDLYPNHLVRLGVGAAERVSTLFGRVRVVSR